MPYIAPPAIVAAPARTALPYGLGSVLGWRSGDRFLTGVTWVSITLDPAGGRGGPECDPEAVVGLPKEFDGDRTIGNATPFVVYGHDACNMVANSPEEAQEFATAHLLTREEARAEQALWYGDLGNVPNFVGANGYIAPVDLGAFPVVDALAAVEQGIAENYGSVGVIHMSRGTATLLAKHLDKRGGRLYTRGLDTPVVAGTGYPDGVIVGTSALFGYRGDLITSSNRPGDLLDRSDNTMYAVAEREYVIGFDPAPVVRATITTGGGGGGVDPADLARIAALESSMADVQAAVETIPTVPADIGAAPASHTHAAADIASGTLNIARIPTGTSASTVALGNHSHTAAAVGAAPATHTHAAADIASGTLDVARIPTGTTASTVALGNHTHTAAAVGAAPASHTHAIANVTNLQGELDSKVETVVAGTGVTVDSTDPQNPIVSVP